MAPRKEAVGNIASKQDNQWNSIQKEDEKGDMTTMSTKPSTAKIIKLSVGSYTILNEYTGENATKHRGSQCMSPLRDRLRYGHFGSSINPHMWKCTTSWTKGSCDIPRRKFWFPCSQNLAWHWPLVPVICTVVFIMSPMINASTNQSIRDIAWGSTTSVRPGDRIFMRTRHETPDTQSGAYSWGPWGRMTSCTRTCGLGVRYRRRVCYKVRGGEMELASSADSCSGPERRYETCPGQPACLNDEDLRFQQCAVYNSQPYKGRLYRWKPYKRKPGHTHSVQINSCALVCCAEGFSARHFAVRFSSKVRDGTPCDFGLDDLDLGIRGVCIKGSCMRVGCDGVLNSDRVLDQCSVCGGDNSTCLTISGEVIKQVSMGYANLVTIPRDASHIRIVEVVDTSAVFAVRNDEGILFVNGRSSENYPTVYRHVPGLIFRYYHSLYSHDGLERLEGDGHSNETLYIMILQPGKLGEVRISYQYSLPRPLGADESENTGTNDDPTSVGNSLSYEGPPVTTPEPHFIPEHGPNARWEAMRVLQNNDAQNVGETSRLASPSSETSITTTSGSYTSANINVTEDSFPNPEVGMPGESVPANVGGKYRNPQTNSGSYRYFWKIDASAPCSATCTSGVQTRYVTCFRSDNVAVENSFCEEDQRPKPVNVRCHGRPCSPRWVASLWSSCSVSCGAGQQYRTVHCWRMMAPGFDSTVLDYLCSTLDKPFLVRPCKEVDCGPLWETSQWGECSRKCGHGIQTRNVRCSSSTNPCDANTKPRTSRRCMLGPCVDEWIVSDWGECSGDCKSGIRKRSVTCRDNDGEFLHDKYCDEKTRPLSVQACTTDNGSCQPKWVSQDWGVCSVDCDWGETSRDVACGSVINGSFRQLPDTACVGQRLPRKVAKCREPPCKARWHFTNWSQCSKSCGEGGVRVRKVACYRDNKPSRHCDATIKPASTDVCTKRSCQQEVETDRGP